MTQAELFTPAETVSREAKAPDTIPEVMAMGYDNPKAANPYYWSSSFWEAFALGQHMQQHGFSIEGFRKGRGSTYTNGRGLAFRFAYDAGMWALWRA